MTRTKKAKTDQEEARKQLRGILKPGDTVYTVLRHVSRSGMFRRIDLYKMDADGPRYLTGWVAAAMGEKVHRDGGMGVGGCGMDMGFHLVYNLSTALFCPDKYDHDAAYALKHRWL